MGQVAHQRVSGSAAGEVGRVRPRTAESSTPMCPVGLKPLPDTYN
jgi:hypothetical protein